MDKNQFWQIIKEQKEKFGEDLDAYYNGLVASCSAYFKKLGMKERDYGHFYKELDRHPLSAALKNDLEAEITYGHDIDIKWDEDELEEILPRLCDKFQW